MPQLAQPLLVALSERTRESASLGMLLGDDVVIVARAIARRSLSTGLAIGSRLPSYCSALGGVLLAAFEPLEARRRVDQMQRAALTPRTLWRSNDVVAEVARCREQGWSESDEELELGVRSTAIPVFDRARDALATRLPADCAHPGRAQWSRCGGHLGTSMQSVVGETLERPSFFRDAQIS